MYISPFYNRFNSYFFNPACPWILVLFGIVYLVVGYQKKGYPKQRPKNCLDPKKQEPIEQTRSRPKSPIRPRPPRRGLRRSTDSLIRVRPARHQARDRRFDQTALAEHHIQSKRSTTPTNRTTAQYSEVADYTSVASTPGHLRRDKAGVTDHCAA